ncbi:MAG: RDD family protein [Acidobacteriota bacterium]
MEEMIKPEAEKNTSLFDQQDNNMDLTGLAGRGDRLAAAIIDSLILLIPNISAGVLFFGFNAYLENLTSRNFVFTVSNLFLGLLVSLLFNGYLLYKYGQTIGKKIMDIKIVDMNNNLPTLFKSFFLRSFLFAVLYLIPFVNIVVMLDVFFIFSKSRRCLHDRFAGTKVIVAETAEE